MKITGAEDIGLAVKDRIIGVRTGDAVGTKVIRER